MKTWHRDKAELGINCGNTESYHSELSDKKWKGSQLIGKNLEKGRENLNNNHTECMSAICCGVQISNCIMFKSQTAGA